MPSVTYKPFATFVGSKPFVAYMQFVASTWLATVIRCIEVDVGAVAAAMIRQHFLLIVEINLKFVIAFAWD